jgi:DNA polymerase elongation subunit (family B)
MKNIGIINGYNDTELHQNVCIRNVKQIIEKEPVSIYADTDSLFVSFKPAITHSDWKNLFFSNLDKLTKKHIILQGTRRNKIR